MRLPSNKNTNDRHIITSINSATSHLTNNKPSNDSHIIASINNASSLVRRKILRLYFGLPANYRTHLLLIIMMASASRDAKSCVSRAINSATTGT